MSSLSSASFSACAAALAAIASASSFFAAAISSARRLSLLFITAAEDARRPPYDEINGRPPSMRSDKPAGVHANAHERTAKSDATRSIVAR